MEEKNNNQDLVSPEEETLQILEQDLRELELYIQDFWRFLPLPICYVNPVHNILDVDNSLVKFSGYKATELIGEDIEKLFKDEKIKELKKKIFEQDFIEFGKMIFLTKDKKEIPTKVSAMARKSEEGDVIGYFLSIIDISETLKFQEKLQEEVKKKTQELQEKLEELETFHKIAVGRELKMIELKEKINQLEKEIAKYKKVEK